MEKKNIFLIVAIVVLFAFGFVFPRSINVTVDVPKADQELGGFPGPDMYANVNVHGTFIKGDNTALATTTTATAYTFVEKDLMPYSMLDIMENKGAATFTLPATSTMFKLLGGSGIGSSRDFLFHNATSGSGITMTIAAGAGMDLIAVTANDDVIDEGEYSRLSCTVIPYRAADNENIVCIIDELANAD